MNEPADLELSLAPVDEAFRLTLRYRRPGDAGEDVRGPYPVQLDHNQLRALALDPLGYGEALTAQLFRDPHARREFISLCDGSFESVEYLRIRFLFQDPTLHRLRWELLSDPTRGEPLALSTRLLISRFISAQRRGRVELRQRDALRALVAVAAPRDLLDYSLAPIDVPAEVARVRAALANVRVEILGEAEPCTLHTLGDRLRTGEGYDILYLIAHGALRDGKPHLYLAGADGMVSSQGGETLAELLASLDMRQPRLVVLASCESAGDGYSDTLAALGPLLALAGIPAVLAMQGQISVATIERFAPAFFRELLRDGLADRALAVAHLAVRDRPDWWMPVLFTRLREGRIWAEPKHTTAVPEGLTSPYRALEAFTLAEAHLFFGRDALITEGYERWLASNRRFLAVVGASGSGKSSLAQAGLLPRFQRDLTELGSVPTVLIMRPGEQPLRALQDALRRQRLRIPADFAERLSDDPALLLQALRQALPKDDGEPAALLLVDQFEELFTLCADEHQRRAFDAALAHVAAQPGGPVSVLLTLRSDFYRHSAGLALRALIATYQVHVRHLHAAEMQQAITGPVRAVANAGSPAFEPGLVELMIEETGSSPGALPLLSVALSRLWDAGALDLATYRRLGGVRGALEQQAEQLYAELPLGEQRATRYLLLQLVQLGEGNEDTRRRVPLAELTPSGRTPKQTETLVQRLSASRLVSTSDVGEPVVEVSHEALIRGWGRLRGWLEEDRELVRLHRQISEAARLWHGSGQDKSHLWTGARLAATGERGASLEERVTSGESEFLAASRAEQQLQLARQRRGRIIAVVAVVAVLAVLALGGLVGMIWRQGQALEAANSDLVIANTQVADERDDAQQAQGTAEQAGAEEAIARQTAVAAQVQVEQLQRETLSRRLAAESQAIRDNQPGLALTQAIEALRVAETFEANDAVRSWLNQPKYNVKRALFHDGRVNGAVWNADESRILTWSVDGTAKLWDADGALLATLPHDSEVNGAVWNADESRILTWSVDGTAKLWDADGALLATLPHDGRVNGVVWNADESRILTWSVDGTAKLWDAGGALLATLPHDEAVWGAVWNADESRILTWGDNGTAKLWDVDGMPLVSLPHDGRVYGAAWDADESRILTWSDDGTAKLWDADGTPLATLPHDGRVNGAVWNADDSRILTWGDNGTAKLWGADGTPLASLPHGGGVNGPVWNADDSRILTWSWDGTAKLWDADGASLASLPHDDVVLGAAWNADESHILTRSRDGTAKLWGADGTPLASLPHDDGVNGAVWNADESRILTWSEDGTAKLWDAAGTPLASLPHDEAVLGAVWNADESRILTWSEDGTAKLWDAAGALLVILPHDGKVNGAVWNANGSRILTWSEDGTAKLWDAAGAPLASLPHDGGVLGAVWNADESRILTWGGGTAKLWDADGAPLATLPNEAVWNAVWNADESRILTWGGGTAKLWDAAGTPLASLPHDGGVLGAAWNADESHILTWSDDGTAKLWDAAGTPLVSLPHGGQVSGAAWNANGSRILTWSWDGTAKLWDADGAPLATLPHDDMVNGAAWNADESRILTWSDDGTAKLWDAEGAPLVSLPHDGRVYGAAWNADESRILTWGDNGMARLWGADGIPLVTLSHDDIVNDAAWNADESRILTWSVDGTAKLWDADGMPLASLPHEGGVYAAWNADESRILTWSDNGTAKLWDAAGTPLASLPHDDVVLGAAWNADESHILTWSWDGTAKIHYADSADLIAPACRAAGRNLSLNEWRSYMGTLPYHRTCEQLPLHRSYREDVAARLQSGQLSLADAVDEVARALQVDLYATGEPPAELIEAARAIVADLGE